MDRFIFSNPSHIEPTPISAMSKFAWILFTALAVMLILSGGGVLAQPTAKATAFSAEDLSDAALVKLLPGFESRQAKVNGVRLHYVVGGKGDLVVLLPGWPETWWSYHKVMPGLAQHYRVVSVDIRGMGSSDKPPGGYDKKTMAKDVLDLIRQLGYEKAHIVGHDIGAQVAQSFAANHPSASRKLVLMDVPHPDESLLSWPLLPAHGTFTDKIDPRFPYAWWFAFHQVRELPEQLMEGRVHLHHNWFFKYLLMDEAAISPRDRAVYAAAYNSASAIRAGNGWYQAFTQDIIDDKTYKKLEMPVLGIGGPGYGWLKSTLEKKAKNAKVVHFEDSGHFMHEEQPQRTLSVLLDFLK